MKRAILVASFTLMVILPGVAYAQLTGTWHGNDGGTYYIRQIGSEIFWYGENDDVNPHFSNVAHGKAHAGTIILSWADVPKGETVASGTLVLQIVNNNRLQAVRKTGPFGGSLWTR